jgi:hypothetical protein
MQSGMAKTKNWVVEWCSSSAQYMDPLMGWTGSNDTTHQIKLYFKSKEEAIAYAQRQHLAFTVQEETRPQIRPKSYADHFKANKPPL